MWWQIDLLATIRSQSNTTSWHWHEALTSWRCTDMEHWLTWRLMLSHVWCEGPGLAPAWSHSIISPPRLSRVLSLNLNCQEVEQSVERRISGAVWNTKCDGCTHLLKVGSQSFNEKHLRTWCFEFRLGVYAMRLTWTLKALIKIMKWDCFLSTK